ncbi:MAG: hypothetical protein K8R60_11445 [Burkholderiales bacterium]|nr:hypothetical protein [Burkholderiales bacterium]
MSARVFVSHRQGDGAGLAAAMAEELDALFGDGQVARLDADGPSGERWREALAGAAGAVPILLLLVSSDVSATLAADTSAEDGEVGNDDPVRALLDAGLAAGALVRPVLAGSMASLPAAEDLPAPFERASRLPRRPLRAAEWAGDIARVAEDLRALGVRPIAGTQPGTMPAPLPQHGPTTTPMPLDEGGSELGSSADGGRRGVLGMVTVAALLVGGWGVWRWQQRRAANLTGVWHGRIGLRDAPTSREGGLMLVTLSQKNRSVGLSSTVGIENDPQWEPVRDAWKERTGGELKQVVYRGEGEFIDEGETATRPASAPAAASSDAASAAPTKAEAERTRRIDPTLGMRRIVIPVRIASPGPNGEKIDEGVFRGVVDIGDQRIHGRLWLESEQAERVVDLRRD